MEARNIILVGYRGCGKSGVGRELARRLGWEFVDTDEQIAATSGQSIREIFQTVGEAAFRTLECDAISAAVQAPRRVLSVGGGAVLSESNRKALRATGVCIWLTAPAAELWRRMQADPQTSAGRPALTLQGGLAEVERLLAERTPLYAAVAAHVVDTAGRMIAEVADEILAWLAADTGPRKLH